MQKNVYEIWALGKYGNDLTKLEISNLHEMSISVYLGEIRKKNV